MIPDLGSTPFEWDHLGDGKLLPILRAFIKYDNRGLGYATQLLVDTGADGTILTRQQARRLGLMDEDLEEQEGEGNGGRVKVYAPRNPAKAQIQLCGEWIDLPSLKFGNGRIAVLGRDVLFDNFTLTMRKRAFDLQWRFPRR